MKGEIKLQLHPGVPLTASLRWEGVSGVRWGAFPADWQACLGVWTSRVLEDKLREMEKESMKLSDGTFSLHTCCECIYLWKYGILDCVLQSQHETTFTSHFISVMWQEIMHEESWRKSKSGQCDFHAELSVCVSDLSTSADLKSPSSWPCLMSLTSGETVGAKRSWQKSLSFSFWQVKSFMWSENRSWKKNIPFLLGQFQSWHCSFYCLK